MCPCGTEYKALSEVDALATRKTSVVCRKCQAIADIAGVVKEHLEAAAEGHWRTIWAKAVVSQSRRAAAQ
jgi:hypothetical protein